MKDYPIETIEWRDSAILNDWTTVDDDCCPQTVLTVGYVVKETVGFVCLAGTIDRYGRCRHVTIIIKGNIEWRSGPIGIGLPHDAATGPIIQESPWFGGHPQEITRVIHSATPTTERF